MFDTLAEKVPKDRDFPERTWRLDVLRRVLNGTLYDVLKHDFHCERTGSDEYIPLRDRKPNVRYNLSRMVVQDSVALLFGEGHFPAVDLTDQAARDSLCAVIKESRLPQAMAAAALRGSIGSVVVQMRVLKGRVFFTPIDTLFLTPKWNPEAPDELLSVTERYKVRGKVLKASGYSVKDDELEVDWWFQRAWDVDAENWFLPTRVKDDAPPLPDPSRTVRHALGFVPMVWVENLPGGDAPDGCCTFRPAVETQIEIEYQLSQAGRGLKYSSDPLLMIKEPASGDNKIIRSAGNALVLDKDGDAKMLEINGTASEAVISYVRALREMALESIHGNRSNADKLSAAQSGRALELLHQPLIWLADELRTSYGENGLLPLVRMIIAASNKMVLQTKSGKVAPLPLGDDPALRWPPWFMPTGRDRTEDAQTITTLVSGGLMSRETGVRQVAAANDVEDVPQEMARIAADMATQDARLAAQAAQVKATEIVES